MRKNLLLVILICFTTIACSLFNSKSSDEVINFENDDPEMNAAIEKAQETLPIFIQTFQDPSPTMTDFSLKVKFPYGDEDGVEHIWMGELEYKNGEFSGIVGNEPEFTTHVKFGERVSFSLSDISDWMIIDNSMLLGGFTVHVIRNQLTEEERVTFDKQVPFIVPDEPKVPQVVMEG